MADPINQVPVTSPVAQERPVVPTRDTVVQDLKTPGVLDTAAALWRRETVLGAAIEEIGLGTADGEFDASFSPYGHFAANKKRYEGIEPWLRRGAFDYVKNAEDFDRMVGRIKSQDEDLRTMHEGSGWGVALGMGMSMIDVMTLVPFAKAQAASRVANAFRVGASGAGIATAQEGALHLMQPSRTAEESFLNIGLTSALGGGIGVFAPITHPKSPLNPRNNPPLDPNAPPAVESLLPGMQRGEGDTVGSVGSARAGVQAGTERAVEDAGLVARGAMKIGEYLSRVTPTGRALTWTSQVARSAAQRLFDLGGIFTRHMTEGVSGGPAAEDIMRDLMGARDELQQSLVDGFRQMQIDMGVSGSTAAATVKGDVNLMSSAVGGKKQLLNTGISEDEFQEIVRRKVTNTAWQDGGLWTVRPADERWMSELVERAGLSPEQAKIIEAKTDEIAKLVQKKALEQEEAMFKAGMITEKQRLGVRYGLAQLWDRGHVQVNQHELRGLLLEVFKKRPDAEWLKETHGLSLDEWRALPDRAQPKLDQATGQPVVDANGVAQMTKGRLDILEEWTGDAAANALEASRIAHAAAEQAYKDALAIKEWVDFGVKLQKGEVTKLTGKELRAHLRTSEAALGVRRMELAKGRVERAEVELGKLETALKEIGDPVVLAEQAAKDRVAPGNALDELGSQIAPLREARDAARGAATEAGKDFRALKRSLGVEEGESNPALVALREQYDAAKQRLAEARQAYNTTVADFQTAAKTLRQEQRWIDAAVDAVNRKKVLEGEPANLPGLERALEADQKRLSELRTKLESLRAARQRARDEYRVLKEGAKNANVSVREAKKGLSAAGREQAKAQRQAALLDTIEEIVSGIGDAGKAPNGLLRDIVGQSGRTKDRRIILTDDERRMFEDRGFLHKDLTYVLDRQYRDISARLALREVYGEESLEKTLKTIYEDYEKLAAANPAQREKLMAEYQAVAQDIQTGRDRLLGVAGRPEDPESLAMWGLAKLRQMTYLRFAAGFVVSSLVDLSAQVLHNGFGKHTLASAKRYVQILKDAKVSPESKELRTLMLAAEMHMAHSTASRQFLLNDLADSRGVGRDGSLTKRFTGAWDRVANSLQSRMNSWSLMGPYNAFVKGVSGLMFVEKLPGLLSKYDDLPPLKKAELASLGIGKDEATQLTAMLEKYGTRDENGFHANAYRWVESAGGEEAARTLRMALRRLMDRSSPTPGIGDLPNFMSKPIGQVLGQFQSYGFGAVNRILMPALQRGLVYGDGRVAAYFTELVALSTLVATIRAYQNGKDPADYTSMQWMKEVVDRGGLTYYMSPYIDAGLKATGMDPGGMSSKYRNNKWWHSLLGPSFGTLDTIGVAGTAAINGDWQKAREKGLMLAPFNQVWRLGNAFANPPD